MTYFMSNKKWVAVSRCSVYYFCASLFDEAWIQVLHRFKSYSEENIMKHSKQKNYVFIVEGKPRKSSAVKDARKKAWKNCGKQWKVLINGTPKFSDEKNSQ